MEKVKRVRGSTPSICEGKKVCTGCNNTKQVSEFYKKTLRTGCVSYRSTCKLCEKEAKKTLKGREQRAKEAVRSREKHPEKIIGIKRKYYASEKGKECKKREDVAYYKSGGRKACEVRRAEKPMSEARRLSRSASNSQRRERCKDLSIAKDELSIFGLKEAHSLRKLRNKLTSTIWNVDHTHPVAKGGTSEYWNIQVVPELWNKQKSHIHSNRYFGAQYKDQKNV